MQFDIGANKESFDYIICHGLFSWVPAFVRQKIMDICRETLSQRGLAVISYNALPGWHIVRGLREIMLYHTRHISAPAEKVREARRIIGLLLERVPKQDTVYRAILQNTYERFKEVPDSYVYHDYLEEVNAQFYFHEFVELAREHGFDYVGDVDIPSMYCGDMRLDDIGVRKDADAMVTHEQYMDFSNNRRFRHSILCKKGQKIDRTLKKEKIMDFFLTGGPQVQMTASGSGQHVTFTNAEGEQFVSRDKIMSAALLAIFDNTMPVAANNIIKHVQQRLGPKNAAPVRQIFIEQALDLVLKGFIRIHSDCPHYTNRVSEKPRAFPLARMQARNKASGTVLNVISHSFPYEGPDRIILSHLDGTKTIEDLVNITIEHLRNNAAAGAPLMSKNTAPLPDRTAIANAIEATLQRMAKQGMLIG